jgi:hypothetical protein
MRPFQIGEFQRHRVTKPFRKFCPVAAVYKIEDVDTAVLWSSGKRLILLDVDNTLTHWRSEEISAEVRGWIAQARNQGFQLCILSNTRHPERLERLAKELDIPALRGKFKPSRDMFLTALERFKATAESSVMIGDQLLTDIFGANRTGIDAIWLERLGHHEFIGTRVNRWLEGHIVRWLYNALATPVDAEPEPATAKKPFWERTIVKQFAKFAVVGGTSFIIDAGLTGLFVNGVFIHGRRLCDIIGDQMLGAFPSLSHSSIAWVTDPTKLGAAPLGAVASLVAMLNSFIWNRSWTFETRGADERLAQLRRFLVVSFIGYGIQVAVSSAVFGVQSESNVKTTTIAKAVGAIVAAFWNFGGQRMYAFRKRHR